MGCCGGNRGVGSPHTPRRMEHGPEAVVSPSTNGDVRIRYVGKDSIAVLGPASGRRYEFNSTTPVGLVRAADASILVRTRLFVTAEVK
jgi:hypothetical protein